jgi:hypothetical protein
MSKVISFASPANEFRFTSETSRLLDSPNIIHNGSLHVLNVTGRGERFISYMMYKGWRCDIDMSRGD